MSQHAFYQQSEKWLYRTLEHQPVMATRMGEHRWDHTLGDLSLDALTAQHQDRLDALAEFQALDPGAFDLDARIDHTLLVHILKNLIREYQHVEPYLRDPGFYLGTALGGVFVLILKDFAPLPDRLRSALARTKQVPEVLAQAKANLDPQAVPPVWAEIALVQAQQAPALFGQLLPGLAAQAAPDLATDLQAAGQLAAAAMIDYARFIEDEILPQADGDFAVGQAVFDEMLREDHMVSYDSDALLDTGWQLFEETMAQMEALGAEMTGKPCPPPQSCPNGRGGLSETVQALLENAKNQHPTADGLLDAYREAMLAAKQFVIDHEMVTIPEGESLEVIETPVYLRPLMPYAAYSQPGILDSVQLGQFFVTPVDPDASPEVQEEKLRGHFWAKLPVIALHEAYPGHHLQLVWANQSTSLPRRMGSFLSTLFIEGWAFYCEELMEQLGFIDEPIQRLGRLNAQLWRAARIIIDVSLHTRDMPVEEAIDFLVKRCGFEYSNAMAEVLRYTGAPTQPQSYLMGKLEILSLIEAYKAANPDVSLREMHDTILGCGSLPPKLLRLRLLGE